MKYITIKKAIILSSVLVICFSPIIVTAVNRNPEEKDKILSIRESLVPMFVTGLITNEKFPFNHINPDVREYILFYLDKDNSNYVYVANGLRLLGFLGRDEDIEFVDRYLQSLLKNIENDDNFRRESDNVALGIGAFAGSMIKRDIKGSKQFYQEYSQISAWMPIEGTNPQNIRLAKKSFSGFIIGAYQYSKEDFILPLLKQKSSDPNFVIGKSLVDNLEKRETGLYSECMKPSPTPENKLKENINKYLEQYGGSIDRLLKKQTYADWRKAQEEQEKTAAAKPDKKPSESFENIDLDSTVEGGNIKAITIDSVKAYLRMPATGNAENVLIKKEFLQDLQKAGLKNFDNFHIKAEVEAAIGNFVPTITSGKENNEAIASEPNIVKDKIAANVTFDIQGTADMLKKYAPDAVHISLLSSKTGDFTVNMIRINENWMWAPVVNSPVSTDSNVVDDKHLIDTVNKAITAYSQISQSIIDGNYDPLTIPLLDNGRLIPLEKRKKDADGMTKALNMEKQILEDLAKAKLNKYGDFNIKVTFEAALDNGILNTETGTMPTDVKGYEIADLTFKIRNGAESYKKIISGRADQSCIDKAGNLQVTMKRINGKWYWNPFGW